MSTIRWGLLSTANINRRLIPAIRASQRGQLTAIASRSQEKADAYAGDLEINHAFGNYEAMLASDVIDAVYISLPNHLHAEWTIKALEAGKHVLCEKPFALSLAEVDAMIAAAQRTGRVLAEAFMYRHHPQIKTAGEWVHSGRLGNITLVRAIFNFHVRSRDNIRLIPEYGGGSLWDVGVYPLSFAQFIMGQAPATVFGSQWLGDTGVDESFAGQLLYQQDRVAQIACSLRASFYTFAEVIGTEGRLTLNRPFVGLEDGHKLTFYPADSRPAEVIPVPQKELYLGQVEDMHAAILDSQPNYLSLSESRHHVATALALYRSANEGRPISLAEN